MIINKEMFLKFLRFHSISGDFANDELILNIKKDSISIVTVSNGKNVVINGKLKGMFEDIGEVALDRVSNLISLVSTFSTKEISISKKDNKLVLESTTDKIKSTFTLKNPEYVINKITTVKLNELLDKAEGNRFTLSKEIINKIISTANAVKAEHIDLKLKEKTLIVSVDNGAQSIDISFDLKEMVKPVLFKLNKAIIDILKLLDGEVIASTNIDSPILFGLLTKDYVINYIVATLKK